MSGVIERFAPSPTGLLHLGHAFSALTAFEAARQMDGRFLLRIEDIDIARSRPEFEVAIYEDLAWLGIEWEMPVMRQSTRLGYYNSAVDRLTEMGLTYPCTCTRKDIEAALSAPQEGAPLGPDGVIYPGTCRNLDPNRKMDIVPAIRLNMAKAVARMGNLEFADIGSIHEGQHEFAASTLIDTCGDIVLSRRDIGTSYHIAVVVDDAAQNVTHVTRGADLFSATQIHVLLQRLLGLPTPVYRHHRLIRDENGRRLAKRDDARAIATYRAEGATPQDIRRMVGL